MKKMTFMLAMIVSVSFAATAQDKTTVVKDEKTTKNTSTVPQKVHNTFSDDKQYSGKKTTHKRKVKKTVDGETSTHATKTTTTTSAN